MDLELRDHVAVIPGGSRGIGLRTAAAFAAAGCHVAICSRDEQSLAEAGDALGKSGREVLAVNADVTDADDAARFVSACSATFGRIDCLVNNVGGSMGGKLVESTDEEWRETFERNLFHAVRMIRLVVPVMAAGGGGSITNVASISGWRPQLSGTLQYGASKAALIFLAEPLALELARYGIRVNTVSPGSITWEGGGWDRFRERDPEAYTAYIRHGSPSGRLGSPEEVADVITFIASRPGAWINGSHVRVDGLQQPVAAADRSLW